MERKYNYLTISFTIEVVEHLLMMRRKLQTYWRILLKIAVMKNVKELAQDGLKFMLEIALSFSSSASQQFVFTSEFTSLHYDVLVHSVCLVSAVLISSCWLQRLSIGLERRACFVPWATFRLTIPSLNWRSFLMMNGQWRRTDSWCLAFGSYRSSDAAPAVSVTFNEPNFNLKVSHTTSLS